MPYRSVGHAVVEQLVELGARRAYLVPGESFLDVLDGMHDSPLEAVVCRQEGGAGFMAVADARLNGGAGVAMVTRGPGAANAAIAVHTAWQDATPMLLFVGLIPVSDRGRESFQEFSLEGWFGTTAKAVLVLENPARATSVVQHAHHLAISGRPGPVVIGLPEEVLRETTQEPVHPARVTPRGAPEEQVASLVELLHGAARPVVVTGGDHFDQASSDRLRRWAEAWRLPVVSDFRAHDKLDHASPSWCGALGYGRSDAAAQLLAEADLVVYLDAVRGDVLTDGYSLGSADTRQVLVGMDPDAHGHDGGIDLHILSAPGDALAALAETVPTELPVWASRTEHARAAYRSWSTPHADHPGDGVDLGAVMSHLAQQLHPDAVVTYGAGNHAIWAQRYLPSHACPSVLSSRNGTMGFGVPAAVAAALTQPGRQVVTIAGDGCFLMNGQELAVAAARGARMLALVVDNGQYGTIRAHQEREYPGRVSGTQLANPDFARLVEGYGGRGWTARTTEEALGALREALEHPGIALLHLVVSSDLLAPASS